MKATLLAELLAARAAKRPVVLVTDLTSGEQRLVERGSATDEDDNAVAATALESDRCQRRGDLFYQPHNPPLRLVVVGAGHVTQSLVPMARLLGYEVLVIDPRPAFANPERFEDVSLSTEWPDEALERIVPDARTAVVTFTHDPKIDDPALVAALGSPAFYVGALGSRKTHEKRLERLKEAGVSEDALRRIHGPIGLPLGGRAPAEIALSTMAQITQVLRGAAP